MSGNFKKEDLRIIKTQRALMNALRTLLNLRNFNKITVNDLCEEALISRAAFYSHYDDKYDLLDSYMEVFFQQITGISSYPQLELTINQFVAGHSKIIKNLLEDANDTVRGALEKKIYSLVAHVTGATENEQKSFDYIILSEFCVGGILNLIMWQVKNKFPVNFPLMNPYLYEIITSAIKWNIK
jgi:AcrR family transcriptional regulator